MTACNAVALTVLYCAVLARAVLSDRSVTLVVTNWGHNPLQISWIHPSSRTSHHINNLQPEKLARINSFVGHEFELRQVPPNNGQGAEGVCETDDQTCRVGYLVVGEEEEQRLRILNNLTVSRNFYDPYDWINQDDEAIVAQWNEKSPPTRQRCRQLFDERTERAAKANSANVSSRKDGTDDTLSQRATDLYYACLEAIAAAKLKAVNDEMEFEISIRDIVSRQMENFTCDDANMPSSPDVDLRTWVGPKDGIERTVHVKLDRPASRIHVIEDFATADECQAMSDAAEPKLSQATVSDGKGGNRLADGRKAMQAGIDPDWSKEAEGDLVARLSRRVYDYAEHELHMNITHHGQENLMSIQYKGRGYNDTAPDRYTPHCDAACGGLPHQYGTRVATMVIYCTIPERGGHTNFQNAHVHVKPQQYAGVFFSYVDPETHLVDRGWTQHSGCPTYEGEKKIVTQWIRYGVSDETPWDSLNTLGIKHSDAGD